MNNKYLRYCIIEPKCRMRLIVLFVLIAVIIGQLWYRGQQKRQLSELNDKVTLIARTKEMEDVLKTKERLAAFQKDQEDALAQVDIEKISGIAMHEGAPSVLIDGIVYNEGSSLGEYEIVKITDELITLINKETNAVRNLYVFE